MRKQIISNICLIVIFLLFSYLFADSIAKYQEEIYQTLNLPAAFPTQTGLTFIWVTVLALIGVSASMILSANTKINRKKNVLINVLIMVVTMYCWVILLFKNQNFAGVIAISVVELLLGLLSMFMSWLVNKKAGYILFFSVLWFLFTLYYGIAFMILN